MSENNIFKYLQCLADTHYDWNIASEAQASPEFIINRFSIISFQD
jgi:hypothetical protein